MTSGSFTQIMIGQNRIGIIGLKEAIETVSLSHAGKPDQEIMDGLYTLLSIRNYIPSSVRDSYKQSFLREFKKELGLPVEEECVNDGIQIAVLGQVCALCAQMKSDILSLLSELKIPADFEHITDPLELASYGPVKRPAVVINRKIVSNGLILSKEQLKSIIMNELTMT